MDKLSEPSQAELARTVFEAEYAKLHAARPPEAPLAYRQPKEVLRHMHENLTANTKRPVARQVYRKVVIAAGSKHFSNKRQSELTPEPVGKLRLGCANRGKMLMCHVCAHPCRTSALQLLVQDRSGWVVPLSIYYASANLESQCRVGVKLLIREPWLKESRDGYYIRVDSPSDIEIWPAFRYAPVDHLDMKARLGEARARGGDAFAKGDFIGAINAYEEGLVSCSGHRQTAVVVESIVHLNTAAAYLKLGMPYKALIHLEQCNLDHLESKQKQKHIFRKASALHELHLYQECHDYLSTAGRLQEDSTGELTQLRESASQRTVETLRGEYKWEYLYTEFEKGKSPLIADYIGPVQTQKITGKGNGLVALEDIEPGDLLLVVNPLAVAGNGTAIRSSTLGINCMTGELSPPSVIQVIETLYEKIRDWPKFASKLNTLFAGPGFGRISSTPGAGREDAGGFFDAGRMEALVTRNAFRPRCITSARIVENVKESRTGVSGDSDNLSASCAIYHIPSMINHSCIGNSTFYFFGSVIVVRATRRIKKGDEILSPYCDSTQTLGERREKLHHHDFQCSCTLCTEDSRLNQGALIQARQRLKQMSADDTPAPQALVRLIMEFKEIYGPQRTSPSYLLNPCYQLLSVALAKTGSPNQDVEAAEVAALEALGAKILKISASDAKDRVDARLIIEDPVIAIEEAVVGCMRIADLYAQGGNKALERAWIMEAKRLHDLEFGPEIFHHRMKLFFGQ